MENSMARKRERERRERILLDCHKTTINVKDKFTLS